MDALVAHDELESPFVHRPLPDSVLLYLPFDQSGPADTPTQRYADLVAGRSAACAAPNCRQPGIASRSGQALRFDGVDNLRVYRRARPALEVAALAAARWTDANVAGLGRDPAARATWSALLPAGLEGYYDVKSRGVDAVDNVDGEPKAQWSGIVDTLAPRFLGGFAQPDENGIAFDLRFEDFSLDPSRLKLPGYCANDVHVTETPCRSPWHLALAEQLTDAAAAARLRARTFGATISCRATYVVADETMTICDHAGNCQDVVYNGPSVGSTSPTATAGPPPTATSTPAASPSATRTAQGTPTATRRPAMGRPRRWRRDRGRLRRGGLGAPT